MQVSAKLRRAEGGYLHWCPGCGEMHLLPDGWTFDGNLEAPTFSPSFLHRGYKRVFADGRWTGEWQKDTGGNPIPMVCHYILTAGVLHFCGDSQHHFAGQSMPLPDLPLYLQD